MAKIKLFQPPPVMGVPCLSSFCIKLEAWLRLTGLEHEVKYTGNIGRAPKKKIPWIEDEGRQMGDSELIIQHLSAKYGKDIDEGLSPAQRAQGRAIQVMADERLYWVLVYSRWIEEENWPVISKLIFRRLPFFLKAFVPAMVRRRVRGAIYGQGLGHHTRDEIYGFGVADVEALSTILGDKDYLIDDQIRHADLAAASQLVSIAIPPLPSPLRDAVRADPKLMAYIARVMEKCGWEVEE